MSTELSWPAEFAELKRLDEALKCGICYEYMNNSMMTSCSHSYCSLCIRKFMHYRNQCPACFEETYEIHLRNNRPLDEVIAVFVKNKDKLIRTLRRAVIPNLVKEVTPMKCPTTSSSPLPAQSKPTPEPTNSKDPPTDPSPKTSTHKPSSPPSASSRDDQVPGTSKDEQPSSSSSGSADIIVNGIKIPAIFNPTVVISKPKRPEEMAACPVCQVDVPAKNINAHLDSCLAIDSGQRPKVTKTKKRDPLPKRLYHLMADKALKKILREYNLNTHGDRRTLINRIQRYTIIYNAENDSPNPRPVSELIAQLERDEKEEKKSNSLLKSLQAQAQRISEDSKLDVTTVEKMNKAYCEANKDSFKKLIEAMREREGKNIRPLKPSRAVYSDDENDPYGKPTGTSPDVLPSTSKMGEPETIESEDDIFLPERKPEGHINWNKTANETDEDSNADSDSAFSENRVEDSDASKPYTLNSIGVSGLRQHSERCRSDSDSDSSSFESVPRCRFRTPVPNMRLRRTKSETSPSPFSSSKGKKRRIATTPPPADESVNEDVVDKDPNLVEEKEVLPVAEADPDALLIQDMLDLAAQDDTPATRTRRRTRGGISTTTPFRSSKRPKRNASPEI